MPKKLSLRIESKVYELIHENINIKREEFE